MGQNINPGQVLTGGQANGQLNQYYGLADTTVTTVTSATITALSTVYTIPAGEATAGSAYELICGGLGTWGSTLQTLTFAVVLNSGGLGVAPQIDPSAFNTSVNVRWSARLAIVCADGVNTWAATLLGNINQTTNALTGTSVASNSVGFADQGGGTAPVSSPITVSLQAHWSAVTGAPTITNNLTIFRKVS